MPLPYDRESLLRLEVETVRILGELNSRDSTSDAEKHATELLRLAAVRQRLGEVREAERLYDESASALWTLGSPLEREAAAIARVLESGLATLDGRYNEALGIIDRLVDQSGGFPQFPTVPTFRSDALLIWLWLLEEKGDAEKLYRATGTAIPLLNPSDHRASNRLVLALALTRRATSADQLGYADDAIEAYERAIAHCEAEDSEIAGGYLLEAMLRVAVVLGTLDREEETEAAFARVLERFGTSTEPSAMRAVEVARMWLEADDDDDLVES
jgi:tetratricopeptide (TPR) repeat protein